MKIKGMIIGVLAGGLLVTGCVNPIEQPANDGNLVTAGLKVSGGNMAQLTAHEMELLFDTVSEMVPDIDADITAEEAAVLCDFLVGNEINALPDFETKFDEIVAAVEAGEDPTELIYIPDGLEDLVVRLGEVNADTLFQAIDGLSASAAR